MIERFRSLKSLRSRGFFSCCMQKNLCELSFWRLHDGIGEVVLQPSWASRIATVETTEVEACFGSIPKELLGPFCCKAMIPVCRQSLVCVVPLRVSRAGGARSNPLDPQADGWKKEYF